MRALVIVCAVLAILAHAVPTFPPGALLALPAVTRVTDEADDHNKEATAEAIFDNCFLAGHVTETTNRGAVPIEEVRLKDRIAPPPGHENCPDPKCGEVENLFRNWTDQVVTIKAVVRPRARERRAQGGGGEAGEEDGEPPSSESSQTIRCTPGHPFFVEGRGFVFAADLRAGDAFEARGVPVVVVSVEVRAERAETFNFEVRCHHTYRVSGAAGQPAVLVHNMSLARLDRLLTRLGERSVRNAMRSERAAARAAGRAYDGRAAGRLAEDMFRSGIDRVNRGLANRGGHYFVQWQPAAVLRAGTARGVPAFLRQGGKLRAFPGSKRMDAGVVDVFMSTVSGRRVMAAGYDITVNAAKASPAATYMRHFPSMEVFSHIAP